MDDSRRCTAKSKRSGERCKRAAAVGGTVCKMHGGAASQVVEAAKRRDAEQKAMAEAQRMVKRDGVDLDPIQHLLDSLHLASALVGVWGQMVSELDELAEEENAEGKTRGELDYERDTDEDSHYELQVQSKDRLLALDRHGQAGVHPFVAHYETAIERRAKLAKMCLDAGVAERQVQLAEGQARLLVAAIQGICKELGHDPADPKVRSVIGRHLRAAG